MRIPVGCLDKNLGLLLCPALLFYFADKGCSGRFVPRSISVEDESLSVQSTAHQRHNDRVWPCNGFDGYAYFVCVLYTLFAGVTYGGATGIADQPCVLTRLFERV